MVRKTLAVLDEVGADDIFFQYDIYHMQIMEGDLAPTIKKHLDRVAHIQLADNPGRNEPGTGEINYPFLFRTLDEIGYRGWIGCEYKPKTTTDEGIGWFAPYKTPASGARGGTLAVARARMLPTRSTTMTRLMWRSICKPME